MKINNISNNINNNTSFRGIGTKAIDGMVKVQDGILKAGLAATFISQDFLGSELPRIVTGLFRNSDKTGELNYKFASMEACRELLTGPPVMALPFAAFALAQKTFGGAVKSPISIIESFSNKLSKTYSNLDSEKISDVNNFKKAFYSTSWKEALETTCGENYKASENIINQLSNLMTELETSKNYTLRDKFKNVEKFRTTKDIMGDISKIVSNEIRSNASSKKSFTRISYLDGLNKEAQSSITSFAEHMKRFTKDSFNFLGEYNKETKDNVLDLINNFKIKRSGARVLTNFATMIAVILYATQVPKLYKSLNKTNPGLIGLTDETEAQNQKIVQKPVNYEAFEKIKESENKVAFRGNIISKVANSVSKEGKIRNIAKAFEFDGADMSCATLLSVLGLGILTPRVLNSYDKHDKREILTRDILTLSTLVVGAKALLKNIVSKFEKSTGIVLSEKPEGYFDKSKTSQFIDRLRPFGGIQVFSNNDISLKYTNIDEMKDGIKGFCKFITETGGDLSKFFSNDKTTKENIEKMVKKAIKDTNNAEIIAAICDKDNDPYIKNIIEVFKKADNSFVKKAKSITGVFGFVSTFFAVPAFMIFLQKFNEKVTKNAVAKELAEKKAIESKFNKIKLTSELKLPDYEKLYTK